jgi:hypothetical protein
MTDLSSYDTTSLGGRLRRLRLAAAFAERQAIIEAEESAVFAFRAAGAVHPAPPASPVPSSAAAVSQSALPYTGAAPLSPAQQSTLAEEEWAMQKPAAAGGGGGRRGASSPASPGLLAGAAPGLGGGAAAPSAVGAPRSAELKKLGLAAGSQAAVVKLASYGAGPVRAASLMNYQSDKGELSLEREDGSLVTGKEAVANLAAHWSEENAREPSNDVLRLDMAFDGKVSEDEARAALADALKGHRFAWRIEERDSSTTIQLVAVAASSGHDENGKRERIYANAKSLDRLYDKIEQAFGRDSDFSNPVWVHGTDGATTQLAGLTKAGQLHAETDAGASIVAAADRLFAKLPSNANRAKPANFNPNLQLAKSWQPSMRSSSPRDFAHVILSAKPGTDKEAFMDAARATLAKEFAGHEYVFVMHTNRQHIHVHAAVRLTSPTGEKLHPGIQDFNRWRETLAEEARERNIPMEAVRRFDQAHAPGYKLKDVKMVERGLASKNARRRIERVKNHEIHRPTRPEGRKRAAEAASQWRSVAARGSTPLPPLAVGAVRLYRAEAATGGGHRATLFVNDRALAESYVAKSGAARLVYIDVPPDRLSDLRPSRDNPTQMFVVPASLHQLVKAVDRQDEAAILPFQRRSEAALAPRSKDQPKPLFEEKQMRTADTMDAARAGLGETFERIRGFLPEGAVKDEFDRRASSILDKAQAATDAQARLERTPGEIEGERFVEPQPTTKISSLITHERKGSEIHYSRHDAATGAYQTLAFVDNGKTLDVRDWNNAESVNAALQVASQKWDSLTINGSDAYKETVARLAAEHGYKITNPELQDRIREIQAEAEAWRQSLAERKDQAEQQQTEATNTTPKAQPEFEGERGETAGGPILNTTPAERRVELESVRQRVIDEAERETQQANRAAAAHETNAASTSEAIPYRSQEEARVAREAERTVENSASRTIPSDPNQSEAVQTLRHEQQRVFNQEERDQQRQIDLENQARLHREEEQRQRGEQEAEGESM